MYLTLDFAATLDFCSKTADACRKLFGVPTVSVDSSTNLILGIPSHTANIYSGAASFEGPTTVGVNNVTTLLNEKYTNDISYR